MNSYNIIFFFLISGKSVQDVESLYYNLKEKVFVGVRPYEAGPLEEILIKEFGEETVMSSIKSPRVMVTSTLADRLPPDLHLFRNYQSPMNVLGKNYSVKSSLLRRVNPIKFHVHFCPFLCSYINLYTIFHMR